MLKISMDFGNCTEAITRQPIDRLSPMHELLSQVRHTPFLYNGWEVGGQDIFAGRQDKITGTKEIAKAVAPNFRVSPLFPY
jgi:hypothetical protein